MRAARQADSLRDKCIRALPIGSSRSPTSLISRFQIDSYQMLSSVGRPAIVAHVLPWAEIAARPASADRLASPHLGCRSSLSSLVVSSRPSSAPTSSTWTSTAAASPSPSPLTGMTVFATALWSCLAILMTVFAFQEARKPHPWSAPAPEQPSCNGVILARVLDSLISCDR